MLNAQMLRFVQEQKLIVVKGHHILLAFVMPIEFVLPRIVFVSIDNEFSFVKPKYIISIQNFWNKTRNLFLQLKVQPKIIMGMIVRRFVTLTALIRKLNALEQPMTKDADDPTAVLLKVQTKMETFALEYAL